MKEITSRPALSGQTQVPLYSSKWRPVVQVIEIDSPSIQLKNMLQTDGSGWAKNPLRLGQFFVGWGGSKKLL